MVQINYILSLQAACQIPWFLVVLPVANAWLLRIKGNAVSSNRTLAVCLVSLLGFDALFMGLAPTAPAFIVGENLRNKCTRLQTTKYLNSLLDSYHRQWIYGHCEIALNGTHNRGSAVYSLHFNNSLRRSSNSLSSPNFTVVLFVGCPERWADGVTTILHRFHFVYFSRTWPCIQQFQ